MKIQYTQNNHLVGSYVGARPGDYVPGGDFFIKTGDLARMPESPLQEAVRAAHEIYQQHSNLWILLSGGVDSEAMARVFMMSKIPFKIIIMRFKNGLNEHDIRHAIEFCETHYLKYEFFDLDALDYFYSGRFWQDADAYRCTSPQLCTHLELMKQIPGTSLMPWSPIAIRNHGHGPQVELPQDYYFTYYRILEKESLSGIPFFFLYTPELISSFFRLPITRRWISEIRNATVEEEYALKCAQYNAAGIPITPRPQKYTGFETLKHEIARIENKDLTEFDNLFRKPLVAKYPHPATSRAIVPKSLFDSAHTNTFFKISG